MKVGIITNTVLLFFCLRESSVSFRRAGLGTILPKRAAQSKVQLPLEIFKLLEFDF